MQLLKKTLKLQIDRDRYVIVIPREKDNIQNCLQGFKRAFKVKYFSSFLRKYEIRPQKNKCKL